MSSSEVPDVVILRLPVYVRVLDQLVAMGQSVVNSDQLGLLLGMTPAQIRKDLSYFGRFGKQGQGYDVSFLMEELRRILNLDKDWLCCLVGVGRLGQAVINHPGFVPEGFNIVAAFDSDSEQIGKNVGGMQVKPMSVLSDMVGSGMVEIGIVAVPSIEAQSVIDELVISGIKGILNYAPIAPIVLGDVVIRNIDPVLSLQSMPYYLE